MSIRADIALAIFCMITGVSWGVFIMGRWDYTDSRNQPRNKKDVTAHKRRK